jgi:MOSC domain-containing protein YiiM
MAGPDPAGARVAGLLVRPAKGAEPVLVEEAHFREGGGLDGDHETRAARGVTLIDAEGWAEAARAIGDPALPWHIRRANVLLEGLSVEEAVGRRLRLGGCLLQVESYNPPCAVMDRARPGLQDILAVGFRAGVSARVVQGGRVRVGDPAALEPLEETGRTD